MNIFVLDEQPATAARYHVDRHVAAGIGELAQALTMAHVMLDGRAMAETRVALVDTYTGPGRQSYMSHPCAVWVRESRFNYNWTASLAWHLIQQFTLRFGKGHEWTNIVQDYTRYSPLNIPVIERTPFVQSMPLRFKGSDPIRAYREYYFATRQHLAEWRVVGVPNWWVDMLGEKVSA